MTKTHLLALFLLAAPLACADATPEPAAPPAPPPPETATAAPAPPPAPPEPSPEEKKKAEAARQLAEDRAQMEVDLKAESARWTPDLKAATQKLSATKYPSLKVALAAVLPGAHRKPHNADRDRYRHPAETLAFLGITPSMTVLEYGPGEGWWTEILAPVLAAKGKLLITMGDPNGPADARPTFYAERTKRSLDLAPELFGKVERVVVDGKAPHLDMDGKVDAVLLFRELHGAHQNKLMQALLAESFKALKPGGVLGIEQHRAKPDANPDESAKQGYLPEAWVIQQVEAAGFKLAGKSEVNANPKDTKDYAEGVWTLPPTFRLKDKDRQKYADIGESDRMTLKFVKPKKK
jgi:predicted methyltransferase